MRGRRQDCQDTKIQGERVPAVISGPTAAIKYPPALLNSIRIVSATSLQATECTLHVPGLKAFSNKLTCRFQGSRLAVGTALCNCPTFAMKCGAVCCPHHTQATELRDFIRSQLVVLILSDIADRLNVLAERSMVQRTKKEKSSS